MNLKLILLVLILPVICGTAIADEVHVIASGRTIHHNDDQNLNDNNRGWGFEYDFEQQGNWIPLITGATFKDSNSQTSRYLGGGAKRRFLFGSDPKGFHIDAGVFGFLMRRHDFRNNDPFFAALPFLSFGNDWIAVNATHVPKVQPKMVAFTYFQISFKVIQF